MNPREYTFPEPQCPIIALRSRGFEINDEGRVVVRLTKDGITNVLQYDVVAVHMFDKVFYEARHTCQFGHTIAASLGSVPDAFLGYLPAFYEDVERHYQNFHDYEKCMLFMHMFHERMDR